MMFPELMRCCGLSVNSVRLKGGKKGRYAQEKGRGEEWQPGRTMLALMPKRHGSRREVTACNETGDKKNKVYYPNRRDQGLFFP